MLYQRKCVPWWCSTFLFPNKCVIFSVPTKISPFPWFYRVGFHPCTGGLGAGALNSWDPGLGGNCAVRRWLVRAMVVSQGMGDPQGYYKWSRMIWGYPNDFRNTYSIVMSCKQWLLASTISRIGFLIIHCGSSCCLLMVTARAWYSMAFTRWDPVCQALATTVAFSAVQARWPRFCGGRDDGWLMSLENQSTSIKINRWASWFLINIFQHESIKSHI